MTPTLLRLPRLIGQNKRVRFAAITIEIGY
jgi:hypothetical protein